MTRSEVQIGTRVRSLVPFAGVPQGTQGVVDELYHDGRGCMVAWDLPDEPLPPGYTHHDGKPAWASRILRDGFSKSELKWLEIVR